jgi:hypothetical protein
MWWYSNEQGHPRLSCTPIRSRCPSHRAFLGYTWAVPRAFLPYCTPKLLNYFYYLIFVRYLSPVRTVWNLGGKRLGGKRLGGKRLNQRLDGQKGPLPTQFLVLVYGPILNIYGIKSGRARLVTFRPYPSLCTAVLVDLSREIRVYSCVHSSTNGTRVYMISILVAVI